jgi:DHA1 family multidrug resistance protein-like MFS transporter
MSGHMRQLYLIAAVTMAGVSAVFALLAELEDRYGLATSTLGWIAGSAFVAALVAQLWLSRYADRGYATRLLRAGVVASAVGLLWFAASTELWQFIAARSLLGAGVGMIIPPARRAIVISAGSNQGEQLGVFYSAYLAGFVFGPPVGGLLTVLGDVRLPFLVFGLLTAASLFTILRMELPEAEFDPDASDGVDRRVLRRLIADRRIVAALLVIVSFRYSIGVFEPLWATHLDDLGAGTILITLSLTGFALPMLLVARHAGRMSDRFGPRWVSLLAALATVPMMATYGYSPTIWLILAMAIPHGLMEAMLSPGSQAAIADASQEKDAASAQGLGEAAGSAAAAVGAFTAAPLFDWLGAGPAWLIAAITMLVLLSLSWALDPPARPTKSVATKRTDLGPQPEQPSVDS